MSTDDSRPMHTPAWGPLATILWGIVILATYITVQVVTVITFFTLARHDMGGDRFESTFQNIQTNGTILGVTAAMGALICVPLTMGIVGLKRGSDLRAYLGLRGVRARTMLLWLAVLCVFQLLADRLAVALDRPVVHEFMLQAYLSAEPLWLLWLAVIVAAPLFEEMLFRGFLFHGLERSRFGAAGAIIIPSLLWTIIHVQYAAFELTIVLLLGILLAVARLRTGSIFVPLMLHSFNNLVATVQTAWYVG